MSAAEQPLVIQQSQQASHNDEAADSETFWMQFTQQRLKAWQTLLKPQWVIGLYVVGGVLFLGLGVFLLLMSWGVEEHTLPYTDVRLDENGVGELNVEVPRDMEPPIWLYYQLDAFHQNHRRYVKSRDDSQLQASKPFKLSERQLPACKPVVMGDNGRPFYPCGLVARSVFNDSFALVAKGPKKDEPWRKVEINSSARTIAWAADVDSGKFKNYDPELRDSAGKTHQELLDMWILQRFPPVACVQTTLSDVKSYNPAYVATRKEGGVTVADCTGYSKNPECKFVDKSGKPIQCTAPEYEVVPIVDWGVESGHFMVWMRVAGLPNFRKLWGRVDERLVAGTKLKVYVASNFPVKGFHGEKAVVISTSSPLGGRNDFLGVGYLVVGVCCLIFGTWFLWKHIQSHA